MTPHNGAKKDDIAKTVILPGDPNRAKLIAENNLTNIKRSKRYTSLHRIL